MNANKLVAHRGDNTNYPENSYAGIEAALQAGALFIEFDVQMNADESLLVFHDINFERTANKSASIFETTDQQLKTFSIHEEKRLGETHYPTHVSHLEEVLALFRRYPNAHAFVEIKAESLSYWGLAKVMDKLHETLKADSSQITIISFSYEALKYTQQHSKLKTGLVFNQYNESIKKNAYDLNPSFLICPYTLFLKYDLWDGDWKWMVYSINDINQMKEAFKLKTLSLIETDNIQLMLRRD